MIVVKVELWSAITHQRTELARMVISNTGESENPRVGDYTCFTAKGRDAETLEANVKRYLTSRSQVDAEKGITRKGAITGFRRLDLHVWNLVARALAAMKYE